MGFNSAFKGLKLLKTPGNGRLNNLNDPVLSVLTKRYSRVIRQFLVLIPVRLFRDLGCSLRLWRNSNDR